MDDSIIARGQVYAIDMRPEEGITPHEGYSSRRKFFIVLGIDNEGVVYGGVVFNSKVNTHMPELVQFYQMPIRYEQYPFLTHRSYVDCASLKRIRSTDLAIKGEYLGAITQEDLELIVNTVVSCPLIPKAELIQFGLSQL